MESPRDGAQSAPEQARSGWQNLFILGIGFVALSFVVFIVVVAHALSGSGGKPPSAAASTAGAGETASATARPTSPAGTQTAPTPTIAAPPAADGDDTPVVACGDLLAPVDKAHRLTADCAPTDLVTLPADISAEGTQRLRAPVAAALEEMFTAAATAGIQLQVNSGYRSYQEQVDTYNYWVRTDGQAYADRTSARPGHSEHQMGTAADIGSNGSYLEDFIGTPGAQWLADNSWTFGFIVSYPDGKESVTGYAAEPWHLRYVGKDVAAAVHASGLTLHEYLLKG